MYKIFLIIVYTMKSVFEGFLLVVCFVFAACFVPCQARSVEMKRYTIDLSESPKTRWNHVLSDYNSSVPLVIKYFQNEVTCIRVFLLSGDVPHPHRYLLKLYSYCWRELWQILIILWVNWGKNFAELQSIGVLIWDYL